MTCKDQHRDGLWSPETRAASTPAPSLPSGAPTSQPLLLSLLLTSGNVTLLLSQSGLLQELAMMMQMKMPGTGSWLPVLSRFHPST